MVDRLTDRNITTADLMTTDNPPPRELIAVVGPMFAGKTDRLITFIKELEYTDWNGILIRPQLDNRYTEDPEVVSHSHKKHDAVIVSEKSPREIIEKIYEIEQAKGKRVDFIAIDEAQFFDMELVDVVDELLKADRVVIVGGLPTDFKHDPFGPMGHLVAKADQRIEETAYCAYVDPESSRKCGHKATRTQRLIDGRPAPKDSPIIQVGGMEAYEPRCPSHHEIPINGTDGESGTLYPANK